MGFWTQLGGGALTFAILIHVVVLIIGAIWILRIPVVPEKIVNFMQGDGGGGARGPETKVQQQRISQITPSSNVKRIFSDGSTSDYSIPDPGDTFGEMSSLTSLTGGGMSDGLGGAGTDSGFGNGDGGGIGDGKDISKIIGLIPESMGKRCSKDDRLSRLRQNGGTPACEDAVVKGLHWLKANQQSDGSWGSSKVAMTGLALLAYFGHCETPLSKDFGDSVYSGITYLVDLGMKQNGKLGTNLAAQPFCYEHGIATYALAEALTFCKELKVEVPGLVEVTEKAGQFIIDNQHDSGGWSYHYAKTAGHPDVSVVGWQIQSLKACSHTGIQFRGLVPAVNKGLEYVNKRQGEGGGFGYQSPPGGNGYSPLTGVGMLCNQMWGEGKAEVRKGAKHLLEHTRFDFTGGAANLYAHYYESQAMMQVGGNGWKKYNALFRDQLLNNQDADGSWKIPGGGGKGAGHGPITDPVYRTTLCVLMLEVYYRFLSTGGGGGLRGDPGI